MSRIHSLRSERGAILVQTAVASLVLVGFGTFVIDHGILSTARHQAQNAADAGAMAGALARAYEDFDDPPAGGGVASQMATQVATTNLVWGASSPDTAAVASFDCPPEIGAGRCVRVDVFRNGENGSTPLPTLFGNVLSIRSQRTKATATARVHVANATNCLRPWAIPDSWTESTADPDFQKYDSAGALLTPHDDYEPPSATGPGTGLQFPTTNADSEALGSAIGFTIADIRDPANPITGNSIVALEPAGGYTASLAACNGLQVTIGDQITISDTPVADTDFVALRDQDPGASWDAVTNSIESSCAPTCASFSPRLVAVAVFDVDVFQYRKALGNWTLCPPASGACQPCPGPATPCVSIVNIVGLFVMNAVPSARLSSYPGLIPTEAPKLTPASSFLKAVTLVR